MYLVHPAVYLPLGLLNLGVQNLWSWLILSFSNIQLCFLLWVLASFSGSIFVCCGKETTRNLCHYISSSNRLSSSAYASVNSPLG